MKKISVIILCYNMENYIDECVESLVNQTLGIDNMELIFVDDASKDSTVEHLKMWEEQYPEQILIVQCARNGKQGTAANIGMSYATGKYLGFVAADDWMELDGFALLLEKAEEYSCDVVSCKFFRNRINGDQIPEHTEKESSLIEVQNVFDADVEWPGNKIHGRVAGSIFRREWLQENEICFPEGLCYEDNYFWSFVALYCRRVYALEKCLYHYRENPNSTTLSRNNNSVFDRLVVEKLKIERYKKLNVFDRFYEDIIIEFFGSYYFNTMFMMAMRFDEPPYDVFCEMKKTIEELFPNYRMNNRLMKSDNALWNMLLKVLDADFNEQQFLLFMQKYRDIH